jgi:hypothetical protein
VWIDLKTNPYETRLRVVGTRIALRPVSRELMGQSTAKHIGDSLASRGLAASRPAKLSAAMPEVHLASGSRGGRSWIA